MALIGETYQFHSLQVNPITLRYLSTKFEKFTAYMVNGEPVD